MKKALPCILFIFFIIGLIGFSTNNNFTFAQKQLEVKYPNIPGAQTPAIKNGIPDYVKYIFNFAILASGFIALVVLIYAGAKYMTSAGNPQAIGDSKEQISGAILGILILFLSYVLLTTINPQLVIFHIGEPTAVISTLKPGILTCKERVDISTAWALINEYQNSATSEERKAEIKKQLDPIIENISQKCYKVEGGGDVIKDFDNEIKYVYLIPNKTGGESYTYYGVILYEDKNFEGKAEVITGNSSVYGEPTEESINGGASSIRPFTMGGNISGSKAILYEETDFNFGGTAPDKKQEEVQFTGCIGSLSFTPQSIEIKGNYIVILYTEAESGGESEVFIDPGDRDLNNNRVSCWQTCTWHGVLPYPCKKSCVQSSCTYAAELSP